MSARCNTRETMSFTSESACITETMRSFFGKESVISSLMSIIKHRNDQSDDPFSELMILAMTVPFSVSMNECGFTPFRSDPTVIIPYSSMNANQIQCMRRCCDFFATSKRYISSVQIGGGLYVGNLLSQEKDQKYFIDPAIILFGCNIILRTCLRHTHKALFNAKETSKQDIEAIEATEAPHTPNAHTPSAHTPHASDASKLADWEDARLRDICNVILQRILAAVLVSSDRIAAAEEMCVEYFNNMK